MYTVKGHEYEWLIKQRAAEKQRRNIRQRTNDDAKQPFVLFGEWLRFAKDVEDWHSLKPYRLYDYYLDYQIECIRHNLEYQSPKVFGLYNTLLD